MSIVRALVAFHVRFLLMSSIAIRIDSVEADQSFGTAASHVITSANVIDVDGKVRISHQVCGIC